MGDSWVEQLCKNATPQIQNDCHETNFVKLGLILTE